MMLSSRKNYALFVLIVACASPVFAGGKDPREVELESRYVAQENPTQSFDEFRKQQIKKHPELGMTREELQVQLAYDRGVKETLNAIGKNDDRLPNPASVAKPVDETPEPPYYGKIQTHQFEQYQKLSDAYVLAKKNENAIKALGLQRIKDAPRAEKTRVESEVKTANEAARAETRKTEKELKELSADDGLIWGSPTSYTNLFFRGFLAFSVVYSAYKAVQAVRDLINDEEEEEQGIYQS